MLIILIECPQFNLGPEYIYRDMIFQSIRFLDHVVSNFADKIPWLGLLDGSMGRYTKNFNYSSLDMMC